MIHISYKDLTEELEYDRLSVLAELEMIWDIPIEKSDNHMWSKKVIYLSHENIINDSIQSHDPIDFLPFVMNDDILRFVMYSDLSVHITLRSQTHLVVVDLESIYDLRNYLG